MGRFDDEPEFLDAAFHRKGKKGRWDIVAAPRFEAPIADTHAHLQLLANPGLALARAGFHGVRFIETMVDCCEDGTTTFDELGVWQQQARELLAEFAAAQSAEGFDGAPSDDSAPVQESASVSSAARGAGAVPARALPEVPHVRIAVGCHPHNARLFDAQAESLLERELRDPRVSALGEVGLDYHYDLSPRETQREVFRRQIRLAKKAGLPLVLHLREAHDEGFEILSEEGFPEAGVLLHCFNLDPEEAKRWIEAGCYLAFGGPVTFKKADEVRESAGLVPLDRLLSETDSPYMSPEPLRGTSCEPGLVLFNVAKLAEVRGCAPGSDAEVEFVEQLYRNSQAFFDRGLTPWQLEAF